MLVVTGGIPNIITMHAMVSEGKGEFEGFLYDYMCTYNTFSTELPLYCKIWKVGIPMEVTD